MSFDDLLKAKSKLTALVNAEERRKSGLSPCKNIKQKLVGAK
jgi:hypothetical protein